MRLTQFAHPTPAHLCGVHHAYLENLVGLLFPAVLTLAACLYCHAGNPTLRTLSKYWSRWIFIPFPEQSDPEFQDLPKICLPRSLRRQKFQGALPFMSTRELRAQTLCPWNVANPSRQVRCRLAVQIPTYVVFLKRRPGPAVEELGIIDDGRSAFRKKTQREEFRILLLTCVISIGL